MSPVRDSRSPGDADGQPFAAGLLEEAYWLRVKAVFVEAVERPDAERGNYVAQACAGDAQLRDEVESLLASDSAAAGFCETPAAALLGRDVPARQPVLGPRLAAGDRLGQYEIISFIAAGGMGEVYRARHMVLGREVAVKTIGPGATDLSARRRLLREAQNASMLAHPNVCTIYEVGEANGAPFIVMEYVDGRPLNAIVRDAVPAVGDALAYAMQVTDALVHAHEHGVIHRDLKSSNIVIRGDGRAIVLDFGLAKHLPPAGPPGSDSSLTGQGTLVGTLSHMAPEILLGHPADVRSDVWALGVLLYELLTGELPFTGYTPFETSSAILGEPARPISGRVPLALRLVIERCLIKNPASRYQSAADVRAALNAVRRRRAWPLIGRLIVSTRRRTLYGIAAGAILLVIAMFAGERLRLRLGSMSGRRVSTLAVLPFANATGDSAAQYYADGITDALIGQLGAVTGVRVISRSSSTRAARAATSADIGRQLHADAIVEGVLRRTSGRVAVDVRLVDPSSGRVLWSDASERDAREVLALQADIVRALAAEIRTGLRPEAHDLLQARAVSPQVYEAYLKGRYEFNHRTPRSLQLAIGYFTRAIQLDPTYAPAHAALADCYNQFGTQMVGVGSPREYRPRAAAEAIKALQIDPLSAEAHAALGYVRHYDWQWVEAEAEFRRAIALNPSYPFARIWYANFLMSRKRLDEATRQVYAAREIDPFSLIVNTNVGWVLNAARRYGDAIGQLTRTLELDSTYTQARWRLADALAGAGRYDDALVQAERLVRVSGRSGPSLAEFGSILVRAGKVGEARAVLGELVERSRREYVPPSSIGGFYEDLGDLNGALPWMIAAVAEHGNAIAYLNLDDRNPSLARDPRFLAVLARAGYR